MNRKIGLLLVFLILLNLVFISVQAVERENILDSMFEPFAGWNVGATYEKYWQFIDAFLYFVIFVGIAQMTLSKRFTGKGGKAVSIAIGVALAFAMSYWAYKNDFSFKNFGPIAGIIILIVLSFLLFKLIRGDREEVGAPFAISVAVVYLMLYTFFPQIIETLQQTRWGRFGIAIFNMIAIFAIFYGIPKWLHGRFTGGGTPTGGGEWRGILPGSRKSREEREAGKLAKREKAESKQEKRLANSLRIIGRREFKQIGQTIKDLKRMKELLHMYRRSKDVGLIAEKIEAIIPSVVTADEIERHVEDVISRYNKIIERYEKAKILQQVKGFVDEKDVERGLKERLKTHFGLTNIEELNTKLNKKQLKRIEDDARAIFVVGKKTIQIIEGLENVVGKIKELETEFIEVLTEIQSDIKAGNLTVASTKIDRAIGIKEEQQKLYKRIIKVETQIVRLESWEYKDLENEEETLAVLRKNLGIK